MVGEFLINLEKKSEKESFEFFGRKMTKNTRKSFNFFFKLKEAYPKKKTAKFKTYVKS